MNILISHLGPLSELIPATTVINGIKKRLQDFTITWLVQDDYIYIFKFNKNVHRTITLKDFISENKKYDLLINLYPNFPIKQINKDCISQFCGFDFIEDFDQFKDPILGNEKIVKISNLKLYFILSGMTWKGEGYCLDYKPKNKSKNNRVGVSLSNSNLRNYVLNNLQLEKMKVWYVPYKKNIFKRMDEINKCKNIITDDLITFHLSLFLRKNVYFLKTHKLNFELEMFGNGEIHNVNYNFLNNF